MISQGPTLCSPADIGLIPDRLQQAYDLLQSWVADGSVPAASIAVSRHGQTLAPHAFGRSRFEQQERAVSADSLFLVASVTKPLTAIAVLQLVERGLLSLTDPVQTHIPEFTGPGKEQVKVEHLLTHTSGLPDMLADNIALRSRQAPLSEFVEGVCRSELLFAPGTQVRYQSMGTLLAGELVERRTGQSLRQVMEREIFQPLQMQSSCLGLQQEFSDRTTQVVLPEEQVGTNYHWNTDYWRTFGAPWGGLFTTAGDLMRLLLATLAGGMWQGCRILKNETNRLMLSDRTSLLPQLDEGHRRDSRWGLGWRLGDWGKRASFASFSHGGATCTLVGADPETGLACVLFTTKPGAPLQRVLTAVQTAVIN